MGANATPYNNFPQQILQQPHHKQHQSSQLFNASQFNVNLNQHQQHQQLQQQQHMQRANIFYFNQHQPNALEKQFKSMQLLGAKNGPAQVYHPNALYAAASATPATSASNKIFGANAATTNYFDLNEGSEY